MKSEEVSRIHNEEHRMLTLEEAKRAIEENLNCKWEHGSEKKNNE